jgi:hypothetical protein
LASAAIFHSNLINALLCFALAKYEFAPLFGLPGLCAKTQEY